MTRYAVLGTGAVGGLYGGLLARAGFEVHFLLHSDYDHVCRHGLHVESPWGSFILPSVNAYQSVDEMPPVDVVLVAWKTTSNTALREALPHLMGPRSIDSQIDRSPVVGEPSESMVLVLQNGWDIERDAADVVGAERVLGGCCFLCCTKASPGHIRHSDRGRIVFGEYAPQLAGSTTPRMRTIEADFRKALIEIAATDDLRKARWMKLMWNIPFNGLSVVLDSLTDALMSDPDSADLARQLMEEVRHIAAGCGSPIEAAFAQKLLDDTRSMVPYASSMLVDYRHARRMEIEAIFGNPLRAAQAAGVDAPRLEMLYKQLKFLDSRNKELMR